VPYRIAAPPEPDPPDWEEAYVADLRAKERRSRVLAVAGVAAGVVIGAIGVAIPKPHHDVEPFDKRQALAHTTLAMARERAASEQARFDAGVRAAIGAGVVARPDLGACPVTLPRRTGALHGAAFPLLVVNRADISSTLPSQAVAGLIADIHRAEMHVVAAHFEEASLYARALSRPDRLGHEVVFLASTWKKPLARNDDSYEPGAIAGRAYLYDFASGSVICAADVDAASSRTVGYVYNEGQSTPIAYGRERSLEVYVDEDLAKQLERVIADRMTSRSGPPM
jgi:hypothetical protein